MLESCIKTLQVVCWRSLYDRLEVYAAKSWRSVASHSLRFASLSVPLFRCSVCQEGLTLRLRGQTFYCSFALLVQPPLVASESAAASSPSLSAILCFDPGSADCLRSHMTVCLVSFRREKASVLSAASVL